MLRLRQFAVLGVMSSFLVGVRSSLRKSQASKTFEVFCKVCLDLGRHPPRTSVELGPGGRRLPLQLPCQKRVAARDAGISKSDQLLHCSPPKWLSHPVTLLQTETSDLLRTGKIFGFGFDFLTVASRPIFPSTPHDNHPHPNPSRW